MASTTQVSNLAFQQQKEPLFHPSSDKHFRIHKERPFLASERTTTTVLVGGLSPAHDYLVEAALKSLGLKVIALPPTTLQTFHTGREYCNNGLCNPAYFTVGNLICYLRELEAAGQRKEDIIEHYVFFTAGCNAPCRFGMLETEYRMALADCGFEGFRIMTFENEGGLHQETRGNGLEVNPEFFLAIVNAINLADVINSYGYAIRPFECTAGQTDAVTQKALDLLYQKLAHKKKIQLSKNWKAIFDRLHWSKAMTFLYQFWDQVSSSYYTDALREIKKMYEAVELDRFRSKVAVKITGEFWAITTVGAGNFHMFRYLEQEGCRLYVEPVASLIQFLFSKGILRHSNRKEVLLKAGLKNRWDLKKRINNYLNYQKKMGILRLGNWLYRREYARLLNALGGDRNMLIPQPLLQKMAHPYFNINIEGGEGYMEIAKTMYYHEKGLCHMAISLKPFGCMPSTQSDGAQAKVMEFNRDIIFLPLETAGEGETNAQSRVLMALSDAQVKAKAELAEARKNISTSIDDLRAFVDQHTELKSPSYVIPRQPGVANMAANFIYHVNERLQQEQLHSSNRKPDL